MCSFARLFLPFIILIGTLPLHAQLISFPDSIALYNAQRINVDHKAAQILGAWGIANITAGTVGYFAASSDEWKYFHGMNALWGAVNTGIAAYGLHRARIAYAQKPGFEKAYSQYRSSKNIYLINAGLDIVYAGAGLVLADYGNKNSGSNAPMYRGFGRSIAIQGICLLLFDNFMFAAHNRSNSKWVVIMNEISFINGGIGFVHTF